MVPVILITGFLGSGKTTFVNWILTKYPNKKISVILNEFGNIKLESQFIKTHKEGVIELANGCMCCVAKSDVPRVIDYILENSSDTEYLLIEASGLSDPDPIHESFSDPRISDRVYLHKIICIVDTINFMEMKDSNRTIMAQLADSDIAILSKAITSGSERTKKIEAFLKNIMPMTSILVFEDDLDPNLILGSEARMETDQPNEKNHHHVHDEFFNWWYETSECYDVFQIEKILKNLNKDIIRVKGFFSTRDGQKKLIQFVNGNFEILKSEWQSNEEKLTKILFISISNRQSEIQKAFENIQQ